MSAFDTMQTRLKRFVGERTHMLAAISHDLRTPLARFAGAYRECSAAEGARRRAKTPPRARQPLSFTLSMRIDGGILGKSPREF